MLVDAHHDFQYEKIGPVFILYIYYSFNDIEEVLCVYPASHRGAQASDKNGPQRGIQEGIFPWY